MKALIIITNLILTLAFATHAQTFDKDVISIHIRFQSSFSTLPELYEIRLADREIDKISPITQTPTGKIKKQKKRLNKKKWSSIINLIDSLDFQTLESSYEQGIDGGWYSLQMEDSNGQKREIKIWSGYAPEALVELHKFIRSSF